MVMVSKYADQDLLLLLEREILQDNPAPPNQFPLVPPNQVPRKRKGARGMSAAALSSGMGPSSSTHNATCSRGTAAPRPLLLAVTSSKSQCRLPSYRSCPPSISPWRTHRGLSGAVVRKSRKASSLITRAKLQVEAPLQLRKLGDSDLNVSEIMLGTMTFGEQNTEKESHELLSYAFENGINCLDTAEAYPIPMKAETQGRTDIYIGNWLKSRPRDKVILATKVCGYSERSSYIRDNAKVLRVDAANIKESVEKSLKRLSTDYIDLLQIHWPDRYVALFGEYSYDYSKWRPSVPFVEQLRAFQDLINEGKVRYIGVSNETSFGVMEFVHAAKNEGLPKIVSIQNSYSILVRCKFEVDLVEVCHPNNYNVGLLAYSPLGGGSLSGKYLDLNSDAAKKGRLNLFPGYMERYNKSIAKEATKLYLELGSKHGLSPVQLALGFVRDRPFVTSSIIGATSLDQLKEDIDAFTTTPRPLPAEVYKGIEDIFIRYRDPTIQ